MNQKKLIALGALALLVLIYIYAGTESAGAAAAVIAIGQQSIKQKKRKIERRKKSAQTVNLEQMSDEIKQAREKTRAEKEKWLDRRF